MALIFSTGKAYCNRSRMCSPQLQLFERGAMLKLVEVALYDQRRVRKINASMSIYGLTECKRHYFLDHPTA